MQSIFNAVMTCQEYKERKETIYKLVTEDASASNSNPSAGPRNVFQLEDTTRS